MIVVRFYIAGRLRLESFEDHPPRRGDEVGFEGRVYVAARVVRHRPLCPPDSVNVHLELAEPETIKWPSV